MNTMPFTDLQPVLFQLITMALALFGFSIIVSRGRVLRLLSRLVVRGLTVAGVALILALLAAGVLLALAERLL